MMGRRSKKTSTVQLDIQVSLLRILSYTEVVLVG